ncbi:hypothetical protein [Nocardioides ungokensis]|nr:hypothetical protein [Nocardioides ungokensis]
MSTPSGKRVVLVAAVAENGVIGNGPDIPWRIPGSRPSSSGSPSATRW